MTFNIRYGKAKDGPNHWDLRHELVFDVIRDHRPHVVGMQEVQQRQLLELKAEFPRYEALGVARKDGKTAGEYTTIFYDRARLTSLDSGTFWFSDTPEVPGSRSWGNQIARICTWSRFRDRRDGRTFYFYNMHFDHQSGPSRERSAELLAHRVDAREFSGDPVIIMGDLNAGEHSATLRFLLGKTARAQTTVADAGDRPPPPTLELQDAFDVANPNAKPDGTFNAFKGILASQRIDWILVSPAFTVDAAAIIRDNDNGRYPSDHYPVSARLTR